MPRETIPRHAAVFCCSRNVMRRRQAAASSAAEVRHRPNLKPGNVPRRPRDPAPPTCAAAGRTVKTRQSGRGMSSSEKLGTIGHRRPDRPGQLRHVRAARQLDRLQRRPAGLLVLVGQPHRRRGGLREFRDGVERTMLSWEVFPGVLRTLIAFGMNRDAIAFPGRSIPQVAEALFTLHAGDFPFPEK